MSMIEKWIIIGLVGLGTMLTRFLPFVLFGGDRKRPNWLQVLGKYLPSAVFGLLVIYSLKDVSLITGSRGLPEIIAVLVVIFVHLYKRQMLLSIALGTLTYMFLVQMVF